MTDEDLEERLERALKRNALFGTIAQLGCGGFLIAMLIGMLICVIGFKIFNVI